eukprot:2906419-Pleurochrysis_carterae.AAC.1
MHVRECLRPIRSRVLQERVSKAKERLAKEKAEKALLLQVQIRSRAAFKPAGLSDPMFCPRTAEKVLLDSPLLCRRSFCRLLGCAAASLQAVDGGGRGVAAEKEANVGKGAEAAEAHRVEAQTMEAQKVEAGVGVVAELSQARARARQAPAHANS